MTWVHWKLWTLKLVTFSNTLNSRQWGFLDIVMWLIKTDPKEDYQEWGLGLWTPFSKHNMQGWLGSDWHDFEGDGQLLKKRLFKDR